MTAAKEIKKPETQPVIQPTSQHHQTPALPPLEMVLPSRIAGIKPSEPPKAGTLEARLVAGETGIAAMDVRYRIERLERSRSREFSQKYKAAIISYLQAILKTVEQN